MTFEELYYFVVLVREDNFLNAAETLHISQSSLTKHIQKLEKELNISLFDRNSRKAVITEAGKYFYKEAVKLLKQKEKIIYNLEKYKEGEEIKVGVLPVFNQYNLNSVFKNFKEKYPHIKINFEEGEEESLKSGILNGKFDFIIARDFSDKTIVKEALVARDILIAAVPENHTLTEKKSLALRDLKDENLFLMNKYTTVYQLITKLFDKEKISPKITKTARAETIINCLSFEKATALLPYSSFKIFKNENLKIIKLVPEIKIPVILMRNKKSKITKDMKEFINFFEKF